MNYYILTNRKSLADYDNCNAEDIQDVAYSLDNKTIVIMTDMQLNENDRLSAITKEIFDQKKAEYNTARVQIQTNKPTGELTELKQQLTMTQEALDFIIMGGM